MQSTVKMMSYLSKEMASQAEAAREQQQNKT